MQKNSEDERIKSVHKKEEHIVFLIDDDGKKIRQRSHSLTFLRAANNTYRYYSSRIHRVIVFIVNCIKRMYASFLVFYKTFLSKLKSYTDVSVYYCKRNYKNAYKNYRYYFHKVFNGNKKLIISLSVSLTVIAARIREVFSGMMSAAHDSWRNICEYFERKKNVEPICQESVVEKEVKVKDDVVMKDNIDSDSDIEAEVQKVSVIKACLRSWCGVKFIFVGITSIVKAIFLSIFDIAILGVIALAIIFVYVWHTTPAVDQMLAPNTIAETTIIYDRTGEIVLYEIHGEENRKQISHEEIPDHMRFATISAEDDAFYSHIGIDPFSIARAFKENILRGTTAQGGSTITQQLARNIYLSSEKTLKRKVREAVIAIKIEKRYTKDEILDAYLNIVPYGSNAYGIQAAAKIYFDKDAKDLTLDEAALLASLPKATTTFSPYGTHVNRLIARQKMILERMRELGFVSGDAIDIALESDTLSHVQPFREEIVSPHFVFHAIEALEEKYDRAFVERGGLKVYTTIDLEMQARAEESVKNGVARNVRYGAENAALSAIDPRTGEILAMVGSKDYYAKDIDGQVNVTTRLRQPGSAFKPLAYAAAFEKGYQPESVVFDVRTDFGADGSGKHYVPQNYNGTFRGLVSLRSALAMSLNIPAVKVLYLAGIDNTIDLAQRLGVTSLTERARYGLALVLGGAEVKPLELTAAFGVFANDGLRVPVHAIAKVVDRDGDVIYDASLGLPAQRAISENVARKINMTLSDNALRVPMFGRNNALVIAGKRVAAKTGTTQNYRDAWTVGYTPTLAVGVWAGNNDNRPMYAGAAGLYVAAPLWQDFMTHELVYRDSGEFIPYDVVKTSVPMVNGRAQVQKVVVGDHRIVGAQYEPKKKEKVKIKTIYHSILYYIDKDAPLTSTSANRNDPMLRRWEAGLFSQKNKK